MCRSIVFSLTTIALAGLLMTGAVAGEACRIRVVDQEQGWPVPLVELKTTHQVRFVTDNAGVIAMDDPSLMDREVWFTITGHGYGVEPDGFGFRGIRLTPRRGETITVKVKRFALAKRIGRATGVGLFAESQKLGEETDWQDGVVFGCDSVQNTVHRDRLFWAWGDTTVAGYPLGVFHMTGTFTSRKPFESNVPPLRPKFEPIMDGPKPRALAVIPGSGPTWLTGVASLPDINGLPRMVATYRKIAAPLEVYEAGLCVWDDEQQLFQHVSKLWQKSEGEAIPKVLAEGHPVYSTDEDGKKWVMFGNPFPHVKLPATYEAWQDLSQWELLSPQANLTSAAGPIEPHSGSIAWNEFRQKWVTVFMQKFGKTSPFGTVWYAESPSPTGPWGPAVEILSHDNYTFYNPRIHHEFADGGDHVLLFEGTYSSEFANRPVPTPRYDYNQILYRLDLNESWLPALKAL